VSRLWRDDVGAYLAPHRVCLVRLKRGRKPESGAEHVQALEAGESGAWTPALSAFAELLTHATWRGTRVRVALSDHWARYAIVPWAAALSSTTERLAHARQLLASIYGDAVADWEVRLSEGPPQTTRVVCAMPTALLAGVVAACRDSRAKLVSVQPHLVAAYESWRHRLPRSSAWFVALERGSLAAARIGPDGWDRVHTVRIGSDWARELRRLQTFGRLTSGCPEGGAVYVDAPNAWREVAAHLHWLEEESGPTSTLRRLAQFRRLTA
jgi:hypothetical protein